MKEIKLTPEHHKLAIEAIKSYFQTEREEEISDLAAILLLDFVTKNIGPFIYNQEIKVSHYLMGENIDELFTLENQQTTSHYCDFPLTSSFNSLSIIASTTSRDDTPSNLRPFFMPAR